MLQVLTDGLIIGSIISLGAIGLTVTFSILRFANFGHGELLAWGSYLALSALTLFAAVGLMPAADQPLAIAPFSFGWPLIAALLVAALLTALLALAIDSALFRRLRVQGSITLVIASFGAALAVRNLLLFFYGGIPRYYSSDLQIAIAIVPRSVAGGLRITEPAADLAVAAALISALADQPLPKDCVAFGEVALSGEIRAAGRTDLRLKEAAKLGFASAFAPAAKKGASTSGVKIRAIARIGDLAEAIAPDFSP